MERVGTKNRNSATLSEVILTDRLVMTAAMS